MDFTREPLIETIITPREGYKLVVRSTKHSSHEEHSVDAVEVVSFGKATFFRSVERPHPFLVPTAEYEVVELRDTRMALKLPAAVKSEQREPPPPRRERERERERERPPAPAPVEEGEEETMAEEEGADETQPSFVGQQQQSTAAGGRRRRDRSRRRRGGRAGEREQQPYAGSASPTRSIMEEQAAFGRELARNADSDERAPAAAPQAAAPARPFIPIPPPPTLIRDDVQRLRENEEFRSAFYSREEAEAEGDDAATAEMPSLREQEGPSQEEASFLYSAHTVEESLARDIAEEQ